MPYHFFTIPALAPQAAQDELNAFCAAHRVVAVERQWLADGAQSCWALCVTTLAGPGPLPAALKAERGKSTTRIDYKERLTDTQFTHYAHLRQWRKTVAEREGVPMYAVFTNEQLAAMVTQGVSTLTDLGAIEGIGPARLTRWPARPARRLLEQQGQERPLGLPQRQPPRQCQPQHWLAYCPELNGPRVVDAAGGMDQMPRPACPGRAMATVMVPWPARRGEPPGPRGAGRCRGSRPAPTAPRDAACPGPRPHGLPALPAQFTPPRPQP